MVSLISLKFLAVAFAPITIARWLPLGLLGMTTSGFPAASMILLRDVFRDNCACEGFGDNRGAGVLKLTAESVVDVVGDQAGGSFRRGWAVVENPWLASTDPYCAGEGVRGGNVGTDGDDFKVGG